MRKQFITLYNQVKLKKKNFHNRLRSKHLRYPYRNGKIIATRCLTYDELVGLPIIHNGTEYIFKNSTIFTQNN